jgi:hypothetical protein
MQGLGLEEYAEEVGIEWVQNLTNFGLMYNGLSVNQPIPPQVDGV